jgi:hypothetical protein
MSKAITIQDLRKQYKEAEQSKDFQIFADKQQEVIVRLMKENELLVDKLKQMETVLIKSNKFAMPLSTEEQICIEQVDILKQRSSQRELNLEEVKRLDLLVKNMRLIREQSTQILETQAESTSDSELLAIIESKL